MSLSAAIPDPRFVPGLALHEFESWVLAAVVESGSLLGDQAAAKQLIAVVDQHNGDVELVNDRPETAPSRRLSQARPGYSKTVDGIAAIRSAGLRQVLVRCPTLRDWLERLTAPVA